MVVRPRMTGDGPPSGLAAIENRIARSIDDDRIRTCVCIPGITRGLLVRSVHASCGHSDHVLMDPVPEGRVAATPSASRHCVRLFTSDRCALLSHLPVHASLRRDTNRRLMLLMSTFATTSRACVSRRRNMNPIRILV